MKWSWRLGRLVGIDVRVHWTFLLLLGWIGLSFLLQGDTALAALRGVAVILSFFLCVVLHEYGHALAARAYGVGTRDITLLPIGGVARLETIPSDPKKEFWIAAAGPAVNVVIALAIAAGLSFTGASAIEPQAVESLAGAPFWPLLLGFNVTVVLFNLLPAFPMDGGRILRALLARRTNYVRATRMAANTGQLMAIGFGLIGLVYNPLLLLIAIFVYLGAEAEAQAAHFRAVTDDVAVREAMMTEFHTLSGRDRLARAVQLLLAGAQQDFPVVDADQRYTGVLDRRTLAEALASEGEEGVVGDAMLRDTPHAAPAELLGHAVPRMSESGLRSLPVVRDGEVVGLLTLENLGELIMVRTAVRGNEPVPAADPAQLVSSLD